MLDQTFSIKSLLNVTSRHEIIKFELGRDVNDYKLSLEEISKNISDEDFKISKLKKSAINNKKIYITRCPEDHYAIKKISRDLKRLYKISLTNRDNISEQVLRILETSSSYSIIRLDVKSFYESIRFSDLIIKLKDDKMLSNKSLLLLENLQQTLPDRLPRGLALSPILSEIFMRDLDRRVREIPGVYYYARYVDDIIIISSKEFELIYTQVENIFKENNLKLNHKLFTGNITSIKENRNSKSISFDYLGYKYIVKPSNFNGKRNVDVVLSDDKVRKIKTRIVHALLDRAYSTEFRLLRIIRLENRIKVLSGNYPIRGANKDSNILKGGIFYSNRLVNKAGVFEEFNVFLKKALYTKKNNFFGRAMQRIPEVEKKNICTYSFVSGFVDKTYYKFSVEDMNKIKACWKNKNHKKRR